MPQDATNLPFRAISERLSVYANDDVDGVLIEINWDLPSIIRSRAIDEAWNPATHVVILRDLATHDSLMATTCEDYIIKNWDTTWSRTVLELLNRFTKQLTRVERTQPSLPRSIR